MSPYLDYFYLHSRWHSDDERHVRKMKSYFQRLLGSSLPVDRAAAVLEIGCGRGYALMALGDLGFTHLTGIDADPGQVRHCLDEKLPVLHTPDSGEYLRRHPENWDLVLALDVLEHLPRHEQMGFVESIRRSIRPGGTFICTVPNANSSMAVRQRYIDWTHRISFTEHSLDFLLHSGGFREITIRGAGSPLRPTLSTLFHPRTLRWLLSKGFHAMRRLEMIAELGWREGKSSPLSLLLLGIARRGISIEPGSEHLRSEQ